MFFFFLWNILLVRLFFIFTHVISAFKTLIFCVRIVLVYFYLHHLFLSNYLIIPNLLFWLFSIIVLFIVCYFLFRENLFALFLRSGSLKYLFFFVFSALLPGRILHFPDPPRNSSYHAPADAATCCHAALPSAAGSSHGRHLPRSPIHLPAPAPVCRISSSIFTIIIQFVNALLLLLFPFPSSARLWSHFIFSPAPNDRREFGIFYQARGRRRSPRDFFC